MQFRCNVRVVVSVYCSMSQATRLIVAAMLLALPVMSQQVRTPDLEAQRAAMKRLSFLVGYWSGEARILRAAGTVELIQTEEVQYKLGGLLLMIEGIGRSKSDSKAALQAR